MEKIKVGEYVRTKNGKIKKIIKIDSCIVTVGHGLQEIEYFCRFDKGKSMCAETYNELQIKLKKYIKKHSFKLIDLIEVGDYVNGLLVESIDKFEDGSIYLNFSEARYISGCMEKVIESVATKEIFKSITYKL